MEEEEEAKLAHARGSLLPWLEQLFLSTPLCPPGSSSEVTIFAKANSKAGGCLPPNSNRTHIPFSAVMIDLSAFSTDHRSLGHEDIVSTIVLHSRDPCQGPWLITQMDKWVKDPLCVMVASLGRRWFCFAAWFFSTSVNMLVLEGHKRCNWGELTLKIICIHSYSLNHHCPSIDNSNMLDLCLR